MATTLRSLFSSSALKTHFTFTSPLSFSQPHKLLTPSFNPLSFVRNYSADGLVFTKRTPLLEEKRMMKDHNKRLLAEQYEVKRKLYKAICKDPTLPIEVREKHRMKLSKLPRNSSFTRIRNRCIYTGRPRAVYRFCRFSRIVFRELASKGMLNGITKASW